MNNNDTNFLEARNEELTMSKMEYVVKEVIGKEIEKATSSIISTVVKEMGCVDKSVSDLHSTMLNAYGTQKFKRDMSKIIDIQLGHKKVKSEHLKEAREFVKDEVFIDGEYQNEKIESSSQYREVSRSIGFAINKCADWRAEWFEDTITKKQSIEKKLEQMLKELKND